MLKIEGYGINALIYKGKEILMYRGYDRARKKKVILKTLNPQNLTLVKIDRLKEEYRIIKKLSHLKGVLGVIALESYQSSPVLIMDNFSAQPLQNLIKDGPLKLIDFLEIAIQLCDILDEIHEHRIIHRGINTGQILIDEDAKMKIIDFSNAILLKSGNQQKESFEELSTSLVYIAPEQTGAINRIVDYRSDYYSLGVVLYQLLTAQLPFNTDDNLELTYAHLVQSVVAPDQINNQIPLVVSEIVMSLLAKLPEERYQSLVALKRDLEKCRQSLKFKGEIENFKIGEDDISAKLEISQKLYNRSEEVNKLFNSLKKVNKGGQGLVLIRGRAGVGKTALIAEFKAEYINQKGFFISGKFEKLEQDVPYAAFIKAFKDLIRRILSADEESIAQWKEELLVVLGSNISLIIDLVPELELIVGPQPPLTELAPNEAQNRFNIFLQKFIAIFAKQGAPLIIFLDDLQWADLYSLNLMELIINNSELENLLLIGAYREHEVDLSHPLSSTLARLEEEEIFYQNILLGPLALEDIKNLLADTLEVNEGLEQLARLCLEKTRGNPFFLTQFLYSLFDNNLIEFNREEMQWQWDLEQIKAAQLKKDVLNFIVDKIEQLSPAAQQTLSLAACFGNKFDLKRLLKVSSIERELLSNNLGQALKAGLIIPDDDFYGSIAEGEGAGVVYSFLHDRVQQAVYSTIDVEDRESLHLKIGRLLLDENFEEQQDGELFEVVKHLNIAFELINEEVELRKLAELNLLAAQKAQASAAFKVAFNYFKKAIAALPAQSWERDYKLTFTIYQEAAETAYLSADYDAMESLSDTALARAQGILEKSELYKIRIRAYMAQDKLNQALEIALPLLKSLGIKLPANPNRFHILVEALKLKLNFKLKVDKIEELLELAPIEDNYQREVSDILATIGPVAYRARPKLASMLVLKSINLFIKHGYTPQAAYGYSAYAMILCGVLDQIDRGYDFAQLTLKLVDKIDQEELKPKPLFLIYGLILYWKEHLRNVLEPLLAVHIIAVENGVLEYAASSLGTYCRYSYFAGQELSSLEKEFTKYSSTIDELQQEGVIAFFNIYHQTILNLLNKNRVVTKLVGNVYDEDSILNSQLEVSNRMTMGHLFTSKLMLSYLFGEYEQAAQYSARARDYLDAKISSYSNALFYFYDSLIKLARYNSLAQSKRKALLKEVNKNQKHLQKWAEHAPMNFQHKYYLVAAERARVKKQDMEAIKYYDQAIGLAQENQYLQEEAVANELAAKYYYLEQRIKVAQSYLREAYSCYQNWGAVAKIEALEQDYPQLLGIKESAAVDALIDFPQKVDLDTVIEVGEAISQEIIFEDLISKLIEIMIKNLGAQKAIFIIKEDDQLLIKGVKEVDENKINVLEGRALGTGQDLPGTVINQVLDTQSSIILAKAVASQRFGRDNYIIKKRVKSLLAFPLVNQGRLEGVIYLENNLLEGAFSAENIKVLELLSTQIIAAINKINEYSALQESEENYRQLVDNLTDGIFIMQDQTLKYVNQTLAQILGYEVEEMLEQPFRRFIVENDLNKIERNYYKRIAGEFYFNEYEVIMLHKEESREIIINLSISLINYQGKIAIQGVIKDITDWKQAEEELREYKNHLEELISQKNKELELKSRKLNSYQELVDKNMSLLRTDLSGNIIFVTHAFSQLVGYNEEELLDQDWALFNAPFISEDLYAKLRTKVLAGQLWEGRLKCQHQNGQEFELDAICEPTLDGEQIRGYTVLVKNIIDEN